MVSPTTISTTILLRHNITGKRRQRWLRHHNHHRLLPRSARAPLPIPGERHYQVISACTNGSHMSAVCTRQASLVLAFAHACTTRRHAFSFLFFLNHFYISSEQ